MGVAGLSLAGVDLKAISPSDISLLPKANQKFDKWKTTMVNQDAELAKPVTVIIIGAGNRGNVYSSYSAKFPGSMKVVGVSDINDYRLKKMSAKYNVPVENQFGDWSEVFKRPKFADAVVISTPDNTHFKPCMKALEMGYDVLLEKPIAQTEEECKKILAQTKKYNRIVAVGHVLRYAPYFVAMKEVIDSGTIGRVISIQHLEPIQYAHMSHSYVRGPWQNSKETTPIILAKSCHDLDIIRWMINKPCRTITADGKLTFFKAENAPADAPLRCTDGCPHEPTCPYSAIKIYAKKKSYISVLDVPSIDENLIMEKLRTTKYGRCVFHCDNDQPDNYVVNMTFDDDITASFAMEAFTSYGGRRTRVMGTRGDIVGDMTMFLITDFLTGKKTIWDGKVDEVAAYKNAGHGGGDLLLVRDFVKAVSAQDSSLLSSSIDQSVESHIMGFCAEKSRLSMKKVKI